MEALPILMFRPHARASLAVGGETSHSNPTCNPSYWDIGSKQAQMCIIKIMVSCTIAVAMNRDLADCDPQKPCAHCPILLARQVGAVDTIAMHA